MVLSDSNVSGSGCLCVWWSILCLEFIHFPRTSVVHSPFLSLALSISLSLQLCAWVFNQSYWEENMNIFMNSQSLTCHVRCISLLLYLQDNSSLSSPYICAFEFRGISAQPKLLLMFSLQWELLWGSLTWTGVSSFCILIAFDFVLPCLREGNLVN